MNTMTDINFYIDESGHTGDLLNSGAVFEFAGQPHFTLATVGPMEEGVAHTLLEAVVVSHRLKMQEVKSAQLQSRPAIVRDLVAALRQAQVPIFVEAVDKVFFLVVQIVNCHIMPPTAGGNASAKEQMIRNAFADFLYDNLEDDVLNVFVEACKADTADAVLKSLQRLHDWCQQTEHEMASDGQPTMEAFVLKGIRENAYESIDDFERLMASDSNGYRQFLPLPDARKRGGSYWILPNYSSLTHLYARINKYQQGRLTAVRLIHDEQSQYDDILIEAKTAAEQLQNQAGYNDPVADFGFTERATLEFSESSSTPGLMIADVVAGHVRRVLRDEMEGRAISNVSWEAFIDIWHSPTEDDGTGINFVLPTDAVRRLQATALERHRRQATAAT
jgi:hypothetical protein